MTTFAELTIFALDTLHAAGLSTEQLTADFADVQSGRAAVARERCHAGAETAAVVNDWNEYIDALVDNAQYAAARLADGVVHGGVIFFPTLADARTWDAQA